jgi:DNA-binding LacI/PurR family transcriptional regulator
MNAIGTRLVNTCESERALVTIRQVAQEAEVSVGTVSRVLNNKPGVSERTRQHVLAVADELGYTVLRRFPLTTSTITHLGLLNRPMGEALPANPFYAAVFSGVEQVCHEFRISLSYSSLDIVDGHLRSMPPLLSDERIRGMVLMGAIARGVVESVADAAQLPVVLVDNDFGNCAWDAVMIDNVRGAAMAAEHLMSQGHRRITLLGGPDHPSIIERRAGYEETLRRHDLAPTVVESTGLDIADGERAVIDLLRQAPETTAIMCSNDSQAIGALSGLQGLGYSVPDDLSLVGFDDIPMVQLTSPPLTTIRVGRRALGQVAVQLLLGRIRALDRPAIKATVGVTLIERASVGPPRAHGIIPNTRSPDSVRPQYRKTHPVGHREAVREEP